MAAMAKNPSRVIFSVASASLRKLSTVTATVTATETTTVAKYKEETLFRRLSALGYSVSNVVETINEWIKEGKSIERDEIIKSVIRLRERKQYKIAIKLLEWMEKNGRNFTNSDHALKVDLQSKTRSITSAEKYFNNLPESAKDKLTYGALLNCYCQKKMAEKAMLLFEKMKELNFANVLAYNNILSLHIRMREPEKIPPLVVEMKEKNTTPDIFTYHFLMNSYASLDDIEGVERVMEEIKTNQVQCHWSTYANLASIYVKAGHFDKANAVLKDLEMVENLRDYKAFHILITLYSRTSDSVGVNRVWKTLKSTFPKTTDVSYIVMLQALSTLGDLNGLQKCFEAWESSCLRHDIRVTNVLINFYLNRDMIEEAELLWEKIAKKGAKPNSMTSNMFMNFYVKKQEMNLALKHLEIAALKAEAKEWKLNEETLKKFLKYFEEEKDVIGAKRLCKSLKKLNLLNSEVYASQLRTYIAAEKTEPRMRKWMKEDSVQMTSEIKKLLEKVCPEIEKTCPEKACSSS